MQLKFAEKALNIRPRPWRRTKNYSFKRLKITHIFLVPLGTEKGDPIPRVNPKASLFRSVLYARWR